MLWFYFYFFNSPSEIHTEIFTDKMTEYLGFPRTMGQEGEVGNIEEIKQD